MGIMVLRADGVLESVEKIVPYVEKSGVWNGKMRRKMERAAEYLEADALVFGTYPRNFTVGNLTTEQVLNLQQEALTRGCIDLSKLACQIITEEKAVLEVESGKPYFLGMDYKANMAEHKWLEKLDRQTAPFAAFPWGNGFCGMGGNMRDEDGMWDDDESVN